MRTTQGKSYGLVRATVRAFEHAFDLQVQLNVHLERMPVDNSSVEWPEQLSPRVTVARIGIPRQDISGESNLSAADSTSITPWRSREDHRSMGRSCG